MQGAAACRSDTEVEVSANGADFVEVSDFEYVAPLTASVIKPRAGPPGTRILLTGFHSTEILLHSELKCRFGKSRDARYRRVQWYWLQRTSMERATSSSSVVANGTMHEGTQIFRFRNPLAISRSYLVPHLSMAAARSPLLETGSTPTGFMSVGLEIRLSKRDGWTIHNCYVKYLPTMYRRRST